MVLKKLRERLDASGVKYRVIEHSPAYTAQEVAATAHIPGKEVAKTVIVTSGDTRAMAVLPASHMVDLRLLAKAIGVQHVALSTEAEFKSLFPDTELGAMPPFGSLFGMQVLVARPLSEDREIAFNAGTHRELVMMAYDDFARMEKPAVADFSVPKKTRGPAEGQMLEPR
jgi:Ala-tRNA(Pro) deacylase